MESIPSALITDTLSALLVHAGPGPLAASDVNHISRHNGNAFRATVETVADGIGSDLLVQEGLDHVVDVCRVGRDLDARSVAGEQQGEIIVAARLAGDETGNQRSAADVQRFQCRVVIAPGATEVSAIVLREHDGDYIPITQHPACYAEL